MKRGYIMTMALAIVSIWFTTACSSSPQGMEQRTGEGTEKVYQKTVDLADTLLVDPAQSSADFKIQEADYMNDLVISVTALQGELQGQFQPEIWKSNMEDIMPAYEAAIKHALSIPKPRPELKTMYDSYLEMIDRYKKLPELVRHGIDMKNMGLIKVAFSQLNNNEKRYGQLLKSISGYH